MTTVMSSIQLTHKKGVWGQIFLFIKILFFFLFLNSAKFYKVIESFSKAK